MRNLDLPALESWLWEGACVIRGPVDAPKFKDYILPLVFLKRLSDVFDDELNHLGEEFGSAEKALRIVEKDHKLARFFIPKGAKKRGREWERQVQDVGGATMRRMAYVRDQGLRWTRPVGRV